MQKVPDRGRGIRTNASRALKTRAFNDSQILGERFGEQTAIFEQILTLFEMLGADEQEEILSILEAVKKTSVK